MKEVMIGILAIAVVLFHMWASRRSPRYWFLGGIIPLIWVVLLGVLFSQGMVDLRADWKRILFPTLILILLWIEGQQAARKREMARMKAHDL